MLVRANPGSAVELRAAGATRVAPPLRVWRVPAGELPALRRAGLVSFAEPDRAFQAADGVGASEPLASTEWWRSVIGADVATPPGPGRPVTIVDSGLDMSHEEFANRPNTTLLNRQTVTDDADDHGTEVASVIGAPVNGLGLVGVYPQAVLRSWDASPLGYISTGGAVDGIVTAAKDGVGVINISFGGSVPDPLIEEAILYAFKRGSLVVAASGNDGLDGNQPSYPAVYPHVLTVAATNEQGTGSDFSSQSNWVDLAAPGSDIPVAEPFFDDPTGYITASGTSFSAPMVSAAAAWVWTDRPALDNTQLFDVMRFSATDMSPPGHDRATGFGMLNIPAALAFPAPPKDPLEPNDEIDDVSPHGALGSGEPPITTATKRATTLTARVDRFEDPDDVYRIYVPARGSASVTADEGPVDLRLFAPAAHTIDGLPAATSVHRPGRVAEHATIHNPTNRGVFAYAEVRPDRETIRTSYRLRVSASARP
jgi:subtilase family protein